jgi:hypothetical protein
MRNRYNTQKNNKKNRINNTTKTRNIQRGGRFMDKLAKFSSKYGNNHGYNLNGRHSRGYMDEESYRKSDDSPFGIDLTGLKSSLLSQLMGILQDSEEDDIPPGKKDEIVDYIKNSDYIKELRRSFHNPTDLQKGMQDFIDGIQAKILEYPETWQSSRLEQENIRDANSLLQSSISNFSSAVKEGKEMSIDKLQQLWGVVNSAKDCIGTGIGSKAHSSVGGESNEKGSAHNPDKSKGGILEQVKSAATPGPAGSAATPGPAGSAATAESALPPNLEKGLGSVMSSVASALESKQVGGKVNVHEHPRRYIKEIKDNRKKLYEKEMEIIRSIRKFNNEHTRAHNDLRSRNKYHTRKFRRAILK